MQEAIQSAGRGPHAPKYFSVPVDRVVVNSALLEDSYEPSALSEPQLVFRWGTTLLVRYLCGTLAVADRWLRVNLVGATFQKGRACCFCFETGLLHVCMVFVAATA